VEEQSGQPESYRPGRPAYLRVADRLRQALQEEDWAPGEQLPSAAELGQRLGATRPTVQTAIETLRREGLLSTQQGKGAFVRKRVPLRRLDLNRGSRELRLPLIEPTSKGDNGTYRLISVGPETASAEVAERLGIAKGDRVMARRFLLLDDDEVPLELLASFFRYAFAAGTPFAEPEPAASYDLLQDKFGIQLDTFLWDIRARVPSNDEARHLALSEGDAVLHILRTALDSDGSPVNVLEALLPGNRYVITDQITLDQ
jgi:GntR family transcriptional regulator